jgi:hypothetical protein
VASGGDLRADGFGIAFLEQGLGLSRRTREPVSTIASHPVAGERVFGREPAETGLIDLADERSDGVVIA